MPGLASFQHWQRLPFAQATYDFAQHPAPPRISAAQHQHMQSEESASPISHFFKN
jgi:hypothetical protein